jgi:D-lactate dehydrogenase (cytochrome)
MPWPSCTARRRCSASSPICAKHATPVIPYGTGTSLEGHFYAPFGGISIDLSQMNRILEVNAADLDCRVEAGVTRKQLNAHLRDQGLFFPVDPGADASLGGMTATRASGTNAVRYGTMRENVLNVTAVMANGEIIRTGSRAKKSSAGYDLTRLLVGSEGTLGVITEVALKLYGIPESIVSAVCPFPSVEACCNATITAIQMGLPIARIELVDAEHVKAFNAYSKLDLKVTPTLFLEFHGTEASAQRAGGDLRGHRGRTRRRPLQLATRRKTARSSGRRGTMPSGPPNRSCPARMPSPPTSACRSRGLPNA